MDSHLIYNFEHKPMISYLQTQELYLQWKNCTTVNVKETSESPRDKKEVNHITKKRMSAHVSLM